MSSEQCAYAQHANRKSSRNQFSCSFRPDKENGRFGYIDGYFTTVSPFEAGYQLKAIITLRAFMGKLKPFLEKVQTLDEVMNCYRITGNENIVMEVVLKNQKHLESLIDQLIVYGETKTQIVLSQVVKNNSLKPLDKE